MTTKHTPGPWHVSADGFDESKQAFRFLVSSPARKGQAVDDARLIAAAPELFDFVKRESRVACQDQVVGTECICTSCAAKRLIAKIEGELWLSTESQTKQKSGR